MGDIRLTTARYDECKTALLDFRNMNRPSPQDLAYFDWRYGERPSGTEPLIVWAHGPGGETVGALSLIPRRFAIDGKPCLVGVLGDISVAREWRGRGVAPLMYRHLAGLDEVRRLAACIVLPNEGAARSLAKAGWSAIATLQRHAKLIDAGARFRGRRPAWAWRAAGALANGSARAWYPDLRPRDANRYAYSLLDAPDERFDELWDRIEKRGTAMSFRDRAHLSWRYARHPSRTYRLFALTRDGALAGYVIYHTSGSDCHIDDWLATDAPTSTDLMAFFCAFARRGNDIATVSLRADPHSRPTLPLGRLGFVRRPDYQHAMIADAAMTGVGWRLTGGDKDV